MRKITKVILGISIVLLLSLSIFIVWILKESNWEVFKANYFISSIQSKDMEQWTAEDKFLLFKSYFVRRDIVKALEMAAMLEKDISLLKKEERAYIAGQTGRILQADGNFELELMTYDTYLKDRDPEYYHLCRASSFQSQRDIEREKDELIKAKQITESPELIQIIDKELEKLANE